jgi:hypothetical protein
MALRAWTAVVLCACAAPLHAQKGPPPPSPEELRKQRLFALARDATDWNDKTRLAAWEELLRFGDDGVAKLKSIVTAKLDHDRRALEEWVKPHQAMLRRRYDEALVARRKDALDCIFDVKRYPGENHGIVGQPEVDKWVALVRQAWERPAVFSRSLAPELDALARAMEEDLVYLEATGGGSPEIPTVDRWLERFDATFAREKIGIPPSQVEWNEAVRKYDAEEVLTSADEEERACVLVTNDYREMMGARLLEIDERLVRAARKHSEEMSRLQYFEHSSPVPANANPGLRCAHEGFSGYGGENIAAGMRKGKSAFDGWYHSSGHHRNMLGNHGQIGVGRHEELWTEDFGGGSSLRGRTITDPQILYLGKLKALDPASAESEVALATWCRSERLDDLAQAHARAALVLDPENEKAHALLGETKRDGKWVPLPKPEKHGDR